MKEIKAIIVDDERMARENLHNMLERHCPEIEVVALCENTLQAKASILTENPAVVFLDIKMPNESGLEMLRSLPSKEFAIVFVTAYAEHAIDAFEEAAIDYLLKPIHSNRLKKAVSRVNEWYQAAQSNVNNPSRSEASEFVSTKVPLPVADGLELFETATIVRFQAMGSYTQVHFSDGTRMLVSRNLKKIEALVEHRGFVRVHHSHMVNLDHVHKFSREDGGFLILLDGTQVEVSRRRRAELLHMLGDMG